MWKVRDVMTPDPYAMRDSDDLYLARSIMQLGRIRHIPIVDEDNHFRGLVTHRDILEATVSKLAEVDHSTQAELDASIPIEAIKRTDVKTVTPDTSLRDAAEILYKHKYGCLPVVEGEILVGILTEADFLKLTMQLMDSLDADGSTEFTPTQRTP
ncbi:CBS domain-containing protein [Desulfohalobium retbaense]|uniref:CBS domain containing protein n=1 Tax=Desulfohalobium retbaense (strain ATCC 49708 / DSM 5692 / JCM 16813 / HR100) TaxID=485915 RepID=C8X4I4_DESRD|nr:CBS domain-containing protein [Desulfohalobium retbaense]ACV69207.1 CBS domain containing protein [Desulfohalobium retbaense DSM 5692]